MSIIKDVIAKVKQIDPDQPEFHQAVEEVMETLEPTIKRHPEFVKANIYERIVEPERTIMFRVPWVDDKGKVQVNRGFRVQFNNAIGPFKGGLRFHPSVNLGHHQVPRLRADLQELPDHPAHGRRQGRLRFRSQGQDRTAKSCGSASPSCGSSSATSARKRTCRPATSAWAAGRSAIMYGYYKKIRNEHTGVLTGKGLEYGGSLIRPEATGYGATYFAAEMLATRGLDFKNKIVAVSGAGNVAQYTVEKVNQLGGKVITLCDSSATIVDEKGIDAKKLRLRHGAEERQARTDQGIRRQVQRLLRRRRRASGTSSGTRASRSTSPCPARPRTRSTRPTPQALVKNGCICVAEGANMPSTPEAVKIFQENNVLYGPGKAANAGGVATSGLEMSQNSMKLSWTREEVDNRLLIIMKSIHKACVETAEAYGKKGDYVTGANIAGFTKVAKAMLAYGIV